MQKSSVTVHKTTHRVVLFTAFESLFIFSRKSEKHPQMRMLLAFWRRERDSNPRVLAHKLISSQPRYDHFDISPCEIVWEVSTRNQIDFDVSSTLPVASRFMTTSISLRIRLPLPKRWQRRYYITLFWKMQEYFEKSFVFCDFLSVKLPEGKLRWLPAPRSHRGRV